MKNRARYRILAVSRMTGVPSPTLRAWERRYGIPAPERTGAAYRLYSDEDVDLIRRLKDFTEQGMAPSEAAELIKRFADPDARQHPEPQPPLPDALQEAIERITEAARQFDPAALERAVRQALLLGSARTIFDQVFAPALRRVGEDWHAGRLSIAQEHMATEVLGNATRDLLRLVQPDNPQRRVLLACFQDEHHVLPLYGSALHFVQWGYQVVMLGASTPPEALAHAVASLEPDAVGISITQQFERDRARLLLHAYADACGPTPWVVGGTGTKRLAADIEALGGIVARPAPEYVRDILEQRLQDRDQHEAG